MPLAFAVFRELCLCLKTEFVIREILFQPAPFYDLARKTNGIYFLMNEIFLSVPSGPPSGPVEPGRCDNWLHYQLGVW